MIFLKKMISLMKNKHLYDVIILIQHIVKIEKVAFVFYVNGESHHVVHRIFEKKISHTFQ